ncbi:hypothetical protein M0804_000278 [Polistes exclamans]|nr:hypothetical protein M0804_000278 [Polistes exclamans]
MSCVDSEWLVGSKNVHHCGPTGLCRKDDDADSKSFDAVPCTGFSKLAGWLARISGPINHNYVNSGPVVVRARVRTSPRHRKEVEEEEEDEDEEAEEEKDMLAENVRVEKLDKNTAYWADALPTNLPLSSSSQRVDYPGPPWNFDGTGRPHR